MNDLFDAHKVRLDRAIETSRVRDAWSPFVESPSRRHHPEGAHAAGRAAYEARLGRRFELDLPGTVGWIGSETSPYTRQPLGVRYPAVDPDTLYAGIARAWPAWRRATPQTRVGVCMEMLERWHRQTFENAYATMHTAGQGFLLAFAGSGASSLDRGLEAVAAAHDAMQRIPATATYQRRFGRGAPVTLHKRYRLVPVGVAVVMSCGSYPAWNAWPAVLANLATGNPVVLKPHPDTILPVAIAVETGRAVLAEQGFDPNLLTLAVDTWDDPVAVRLLERPETAIVDFTGGQRFGAYLEQSFPRLQVYTETAGCNAVVLESARDLDAVLGAVAHGLAMFSGQMCTTPQNLWLPRGGVRTDGGTVAPAEVVGRLVGAVDALLGDPAHAAGICGALHSDKTLEAMAELDGFDLARAGTGYGHPDYPEARTATPRIVQLGADQRAVAQREHFGPMSFVQIADDRDAALQAATDDARRFGSIAAYAYTTDAEWQHDVEDAFADAGASVGINLVRQRPIIFAAAMSDFHVTGLNPAGTACLTDPAFVDRRFRVVQSRVELPES
jgi:phenylacetic acid degradation protein paaN